MLNAMNTTQLSGNWWSLALRGLAAVIFGVITLVAPALSLVALVLVFGAYAIVDGILAIAAGVGTPASYGHRWTLVIEGVIGVAIGVATFVWPGLTALGLLYFIAAWALLTGFAEVATAIRLRRAVTGEWALIAAGVLSIIFGLLVAIFPGTGALAVLWLIGAYALVFGVLMIALAVRLRSSQRHSHASVPVGA